MRVIGQLVLLVALIAMTTASATEPVSVTVDGDPYEQQGHLNFPYKIVNNGDLPVSVFVSVALLNREGKEVGHSSDTTLEVRPGQTRRGRVSFLLYGFPSEAEAWEMQWEGFYF